MLSSLHLVYSQQHSYFGECNKTHIRIASSFVGEKEKGHNRGVADIFNRYVGNTLGSPYCAAFVMYCIDVSYPNIYKLTGLAQAIKLDKRIYASDILRRRDKVKCGDVLIWQKGNTIFGHAGIAINNWDYKEGWTIQANTSATNDSREGEGIFRKIARIEPYNYFRIIRVERLYD